jgi:hypothetical protein
LDAWVIFFGCPDVAAIAGALPDTISAAIAAGDISLVIFTRLSPAGLEAKHGKPPKTPANSSLPPSRGRG